jgi:hypothetical protein
LASPPSPCARVDSALLRGLVSPQTSDAHRVATRVLLILSMKVRVTLMMNSVRSTLRFDQGEDGLFHSYTTSHARLACNRAMRMALPGMIGTIGMFLVFCLLPSPSVGVVFSSATSCLQLRPKFVSWSRVSHGRVPSYGGESWSCASHGHVPLYSSSHGLPQAIVTFLFPHRVMARLGSR